MDFFIDSLKNIENKSKHAISIKQLLCNFRQNVIDVATFYKYKYQVCKDYARRYDIEVKVISTHSYFGKASVEYHKITNDKFPVKYFNIHSKDYYNDIDTNSECVYYIFGGIFRENANSDRIDDAIYFIRRVNRLKKK